MISLYLITFLVHISQPFSIDLVDPEEEKAFDNIEKVPVNDAIVGAFDLLTGITGLLDDEGLEPVDDTVDEPVEEEEEETGTISTSVVVNVNVNVDLLGGVTNNVGGLINTLHDNLEENRDTVVEIADGVDSQLQDLGSGLNDFAEAVQENVEGQVNDKLDFGWTWFGKPLSNINKLLGDTVSNLGDTVSNIAENAPSIDDVADNVDTQVNSNRLRSLHGQGLTMSSKIRNRVMRIGAACFLDAEKLRTRLPTA